jgi:predicted small lipoprotein YifL
MLRLIRRSRVIHSPRYALARSGLVDSISLARFALLGALVAALGLAGCGRKSGLDAPPMAAVGDMQTSPQPGTAAASTGATPAAAAPAAKPGAPAPDKRKTVFDWLID